MAIPTISQTIERGWISGYLAGNDNAKGNLFAPRIAAPGSIISITMITYGLKWGYEGGGQTQQTLRSTANYLIWLCGQYGMEAQAISQGAGGGSVVPGGGSLAYALDWRVSGTATGLAPLATGDTSVTLDGTNGMPDFRGYNVDFFRGGTPQYTTPTTDGSTYYEWDRTTGFFELFNGAAGLGEQMRISPIG